MAWLDWLCRGFVTSLVKSLAEVVLYRAVTNRVANESNKLNHALCSMHHGWKFWMKGKKIYRWKKQVMNNWFLGAGIWSPAAYLLADSRNLCISPLHSENMRIFIILYYAWKYLIIIMVSNVLSCVFAASPTDLVRQTSGSWPLTSLRLCPSLKRKLCPSLIVLLIVFMRHGKITLTLETSLPHHTPLLRRPSH